MFRSVKMVIAFITIVMLTGGCAWQEAKKLEKQNAQLRISLEQCNQEKTQIQDKIVQQEKTIRACKANIVKLQQKNALLKNDAIQLRKQIELCRAELTKQKAEKEKYTALVKAYKTEIESMKRALKKAEELIKALENQIEALKKAKRQTSSAPVEN